MSVGLVTVCKGVSTILSIQQLPALNFSQFFNEPIDIRNYLPVFEYDPFFTSEMLPIDICTVSDRTFSGIFPNGIAGCTLPGDIDNTGYLI